MIKRILIGVGAFLLGVALYLLGRDGRRAGAAEHQADALMATHIKKHQNKAEKLNRKAQGHREAAAVAAQATQARLEKISANDTDMDDLLSAWQSERVRQQSSG